MAQLIGRYLKIPYWRLLPGGNQDDVVLDQVKADFWSMPESQKIAKMQSYLYLYGYPVTITGQMDPATRAALQKFSAQYQVANPGVNEQTYVALFSNVPIDFKTQQRSKAMPTIQTAVALASPAPQVTSNALMTQGSISLWTDKQDYQIGETMSVSFTVDRPMYVRLVVINSNGEISTLFPNVYQNDSYCKPGVVYQVPPQNADFTLDIGAPAGVDKIRAIASNRPITADELFFLPDGQFDESKMAKYPVRAATDISIH